MKIFRRCVYLVAWAILRGPAMAADPVASSPSSTLIVPGERIGDITLGGDSTRAEHERGLVDAGITVDGMSTQESWYVGAGRGDKGRPFHRPGEIGLAGQRVQDEAGKISKGFKISDVYATSPRFATAEGIAPGSTLDAIRAKFPDVQPVVANPMKFWPLYGEMEAFQDTKRGIGFVVRKSDSVCIQIVVMPRGSDAEFFYYAAATQDYVVDDINGTVGSVKLGMTGAKLLALLGKPDEKRDVTTTSGGVLWRWRIPQERPMDLPALCVYLKKVPDGTLIVEQIRVSSRAFPLTDKIFPGCPLKDALEATGNMAKIDSFNDQHLDVYGDLRAGVMFDVRQSDSVCTAITIFPALLQVHPQMGARWLDLPPAEVTTGD